MNVVELDADFHGDIAPDAVLDGALGKLKRAVVIGYTKDGELYIADSQGSVASTNLLLDIVKANIIDSVP